MTTGSMAASPRPEGGCPRPAALILLSLFLFASPLSAQDSPDYRRRVAEITALAPLAERVAPVNNFVITRDAGRLTLERGTLTLLGPVGSRTIGAVFRGSGRFRFEPPTPAEREVLRHFAGATVLETPITEAVLLFTDRTMQQLGSLQFAAAPVSEESANRVRDLIGSLRGTADDTFDGDVLTHLLNDDGPGLFMAYLRRQDGEPLLFQLNPALSEAVRLLRQVNRREWGSNWAVVSQFAIASDLALARGWRHRDRLRIPSYRMDVSVTESFSADLVITAAATLMMVAVEPIGPWIRLHLQRGLEVDSAVSQVGGRVQAFKARESSDLWVRLARRLEPGDSLALTIHYRGSTIDRYGDWFYVDPGAAWYPLNGQGEDYATFDITFRSPARYPLASVGERVDSTLAGSVVTTRWLTRAPTHRATFNLGLFDLYQAHFPDAPPVDVLLSESAHRLLGQAFQRLGHYLPQQRNMSRNVGADISNSLKLFTSLFGEAPHPRFIVTEIPYPEGVSFPGLIHLSWGTFQNTSSDGFDEFFRAHEAAHQWWGNAVRPASYRDAWLSEGLSTLAGLWYLQTSRRRNDDYYRYLDEYRGNIFRIRERVGPISAGWRNASPETPRGYQVVVYEKGAWVFHMLRIMMMDLGTLRADRFTAALREFYESYRGHAATTSDLRDVFERHLGSNLGWFFDQWVHGTALPTYRVAWNSVPADGGRHVVRLRVVQEGVPPEFRMPVLVAADLGNNRIARFRITVHGGQTEYTSPPLPAAPRALTFNEFRSVLAEVRMEGR